MQINITMPPTPLLLVVAAALIDEHGRVLLASRPDGKHMAGLWEFPGGKVHEGETPEAALSRELREELQIDIKQEDLVPLTFASHDYETFHLLMPLFACRTWSGVPTPTEGQKIAWVALDNLATYPMPPADVPLVETLKKALA